MPGDTRFHVQVSPDSPAPVRYAASELRRCLMRMTGERVRISFPERLPLEESGSILVGERQHFSDLLARKCPADELDDEIFVTQRDGNCIVTGSNPRSVLFATYDLLENLGARWIAPGYMGEVLPESDCLGLFEQEISERASYRHRGICIEGAPSLEHALSVIDWMGKRKMNTFFLQFKTSIYFWRNYYSREYNKSYGTPQEIDEKRSLEMDNEVIEAAKLRGMVVQRVGHGWTAESIGFRGLGWWQAEREPDEGTRQLLAQVGGKRQFFGNIPINTELCYSNPKAFDGVVNEAVGYARAHCEVDCLHLWLSDSTNNFCECDSCSKLTPSDWYTGLVRAVAARVKKEKLSTRIVFLCYTNTLSPPESEKFSTESDRLIYMFAPISRCYSHPLLDPSCSGRGQAGGWPRNMVQPPRTNAEFVRIRRSWLRAFPGDSFAFEYYLWQPFLRYMNPLGFARLINSDVKGLAAIKLNGMMSCQALRAFYPTGLPMAALAETLWDAQVDLDRIVQEHLQTCFGVNHRFAREYLEGVDSLLRSGELNPHVALLQSGDAEKALELGRYASASAAKMEALRPSNDREERYLSLLKHFNRLLDLRSKASVLKAQGKEEEAAKSVAEASQFLRETERLTHRYLDTWLMLRSIKP